jgi:type IV secretory pathway VirD2 relaxase
MAHIFLEMTSKIKFNIKNQVEDGVKIVTAQKEREIKELSRAKDSQLVSL